MNLVMQDRDKTLYIKLFPTATDNVTTSNTGPASGTGFAVTSNGIIVTNHHVVNGACCATKVRMLINISNFFKRGAFGSLTLVYARQKELFRKIIYLVSAI
jgi:hypothetical protein